MFISIPDILMAMKHMERVQPEMDHLHIRLYQVRNQLIGTNWASEDVCSPYWRFYVNSTDGAAVIMGETRHELIANRIHFVPAWVRWTCHNTTTIEHLFMHFDLLGLPGIVVRECFPGPITLPEDRTLEMAANTLRPMVSGSRHAIDSLATICHCKALLFQALARLLATLPERTFNRISQYARGEGPVSQVVRHIDDHLDAVLTNPNLAKIVGLSEDHFLRIFRKQIGQTPAQYVLERRITAAAELLVFSDDSIDQIASACGFPDRFYFSRMFRRRMGLPPAAYRKTSHQRA